MMEDIPGIDKFQKRLAYYQITSSAFITTGSVLVAFWFVVFTGSAVKNMGLFTNGGWGILAGGIILIVFGATVPIIWIKKMPEKNQ